MGPTAAAATVTATAAATATTTATATVAAAAAAAAADELFDLNATDPYDRTHTWMLVPVYLAQPSVFAPHDASLI